MVSQLHTCCVFEMQLCMLDKSFVKAMQNWHALQPKQSVERSEHSNQTGSKLRLRRSPSSCKLCACSGALHQRSCAHCIVMNVIMSTECVFDNCSTVTETGKHAADRHRQTARQADKRHAADARADVVMRSEGHALPVSLQLTRRKLSACSCCPQGVRSMATAGTVAPSLWCSTAIGYC